MPTKRLETWILIFFIFLTFQYVSFYYISQGVLPRFTLYFLYGVTVALPIILIINIKLALSPYRFAVLISYFIILILSLFYLDDDLGQNVANFVIYLPIISGLFFYKFRADFLQKTFKYISVIALLMLPLIFRSTTIIMSEALKRNYTESPLFFFAALFWAVIPAVLLAVLRSKNIFLSFAYWIGAIVLNLLFLKRFILVDSLVLLIAIILINSTKVKRAFSTWKLLMILLLFILSVFYFKSDSLTKLFDATTNRIETTSQDISGFDRWVETENYFKSASALEIILGKGFTGTHYGLGTKHYALHIGWTNFIFKGGILLFILMLLPFFKLVPMTFHLKSYPVEVQFSYWFLMIYIVRLAYVNMYNFSPDMLIFYYAVYSIMATPINPLKSKKVNLVA